MTLIGALGTINNMIKEGWIFRIEYSSEQPRYVAILEKDDKEIQHRNYGIIRAIEGLAQEHEIKDKF